MQPSNIPSRTNYNNSSYRNNGFIYRVLPLSFNLLQRGNDIRNKYSYRIIKIGDNVTGEDKLGYDYTGIVTNIKYIDDEPVFVYVMDSVTRKTVKLLYDTVRIKKVTESYGFDKSISKLL